jgi:hypothetical protein
MYILTRTITLFLLCTLVPFAAWAADANRFVYLDESDPYYVSRTFPRLTTPQWIGEPGVDAVVFLSIDDMREHDKYEAYLRPILTRLQAVDGRAPVSIMTCTIDPDEPHLQRWLAEGLGIDVHTASHPCPLLGPSDLSWSTADVHDCIENMNTIAGNRGATFRMPCCDSKNTPSPRFFAEIFNAVTPKGQYLDADSSVFNITTPNDPDLPIHLVRDPDGGERFRKYLPFPSFVNTIEDYPYPYIIGRLAWEFPCSVPSDWEAFNLHGRDNPRSIDDMKVAIDVAVRKRGIFTLVFHPHGWMRNDQAVELIDYSERAYGRRVKYLTFTEALNRIQKHALGGVPVRAKDGSDNGVRLLDLNNDGYMDVVIANTERKETRLWSQETGSWTTVPFPTLLAHNKGAHFGSGWAWDDAPVLLDCNGGDQHAWRFDDGAWKEDPTLLAGLPASIPTVGSRLRDLDGDGQCELLIGGGAAPRIYAWCDGQWYPAEYSWPAGVAMATENGADTGLRFADLDEDGDTDMVLSNNERFGVYRFESASAGWQAVHEGSRTVAADGGFSIPPIIEQGTDNGAWFHSGTLWWQNETTDELPDGVDRRSYAQLLGK